MNEIRPEADRDFLRETTTSVAQIRAIHDAITMGEAAQKVLTAELGQRLSDMAAAETDQAVNLLLSIDPTDHAAIRGAQFAAAVPQRALQWLHDLVLEGFAAQENLNSLSNPKD